MRVVYHTCGIFLITKTEHPIFLDSRNERRQIKEAVCIARHRRRKVIKTCETPPSAYFHITKADMRIQTHIHTQQLYIYIYRYLGTDAITCCFCQLQPWWQFQQISQDLFIQFQIQKFTFSSQEFQTDLTWLYVLDKSKKTSIKYISDIFLAVQSREREKRDAVKGSSIDTL